MNQDDRIALVDGDGQYSYTELTARSDRFARGLLGSKADLDEERIALLLPASLDYVTALQGVWRAGGIAIPLNTSAAGPELEHYLGSTAVTRLIATREQQRALRALCQQLNVALLAVDDILAGHAAAALPEVDAGRRAMILFTSGTTSKPKGVVLTHNAIRAQVATLVDAWEWRDSDVIPLFLPLHHIHGIINVLSCALHSGATVHLMPRLDIPALCAEVAAGTFSLFMAVPTVYVKLIDYFGTLTAAGQQAICDGFARMRLNVSGSAACPVKLFQQWQALTGQVLLERYGMTEIGMALSNPYRGERRAGYVGQPLPGVAVNLFDEDDKVIASEATPGEIRIQGDTVFLEYWGNAAATRDSFRNGWFCSGDVAVIEDGYYRIMGRSSVDIIKSGGYKLSALEIEGVLLTHEAIREVAVIGLPDATWGEAVAAAIALREGAVLDHAELKQWCAGRMSAYKIPKHLRILDALPRNAMGKVTKPDLRAHF
ncbi:MAG: acyl-CoA synthetase [Gammaproteobacteria bacterium]|nr:acyl-CoA synthetase [Gammaproteobacteria bacterium]MDH5304640.1 acyl-CoA synthetase [Gammaproteobacteria bacterium]MDH5322503.1 acyl-CoA synthetase [Gammaproteobacteria bacterium]